MTRQEIKAKLKVIQDEKWLLVKNGHYEKACYLRETEKFLEKLLMDELFLDAEKKSGDIKIEDTEEYQKLMEKHGIAF
jgi:hypothetical protein